MSVYRVPLAIHFANLLKFLQQETALAVKEENALPNNGEEKHGSRVSKLRNAYEKLQLWASMLEFRRPRQKSHVGDVLEVIDVLEPGLKEELHRRFSELALHISKYDSMAELSNLDLR